MGAEVADAQIPAATAAPVRLARLDGLRAVAACTVAFGYHAAHLFRDGTFDGAPALVGWVHLWGWLFVDLFFVLSGYIFAHVYLSTPAMLAGGKGLASFAAARFARLYPLHLVLLLVTAVLFADRSENTALAFAAHLLMLQAAVAPVAQTFVGPSWSLSVEVACYVLFALGAAAGPRALRLVTGGAIVLALVMLAMNSAPVGTYARDNFPRGLLGFFVGQVLWHQRARLAAIPAWALALAVPAGLAVPTAPISPILPVALLAWPAALVLALRSGWVERPWLLWLGDRSYAIYLIHMPLIDLAVRLGGKLGGGAGTIVLGHLALIAATLALSDLAYRRLEQPARRAIRAGWSGGQRREAELAS